MIDGLRTFIVKVSAMMKLIFPVRTRLLAATALLSLVAAGSARADIITALNGFGTLPNNGVVAVAGGFAYTYNVELTGQQQLDPATSDSTEFGTVYDFGPVIGSITTTGVMSQFNFTLANLNTPANQTTPTDSAALQNIRFTYTGSNAYAVDNTTNANSIILAARPDNLGTFTVVSPFGPTLGAIQYDGQARKGTTDTITGNVGSTFGPSNVPEPASLVLIAVGATGAFLARHRRRLTSVSIKPL